MKSLLRRVLAGVLLFVLLGPCLTVRAEEEGTKIMGEAEADAEQLRNLLLQMNPGATEEILELPAIYLEEGAVEGVRGDIAFAQACLETGWFVFPGTTAVTFDQYNFCGMGVTSSGMKGNSFASPREGVRAQIQHLKAYASTDDLVNECVDPRFDFVHRGCAPYVEWLGIQENPEGYGWAAGVNYGAHILDILDRMEETVPPVQEEMTEAAQADPQDSSLLDTILHSGGLLLDAIF